MEDEDTIYRVPEDIVNEVHYSLEDELHNREDQLYKISRQMAYVINQFETVRDNCTRYYNTRLTRSGWQGRTYADVTREGKRAIKKDYAK